jgi:hypothetical protein
MQNQYLQIFSNESKKLVHERDRLRYKCKETLLASYLLNYYEERIKAEPFFIKFSYPNSRASPGKQSFPGG